MALKAVVFVLLLQSTYAVINVTMGRSPVSASLGFAKVLKCMFSLDTTEIDSSLLAVKWSFQGTNVATFISNTSAVSRPGMKFMGDVLNHGDASVLFTNVSISDEGVYTCEVQYPPDRATGEITLKPEAQPQMSISSQLTQSRGDVQAKLTCTAVKFYPKDIKILCLRNGTTVADSMVNAPQRNADGTFNSSCIYAFRPTPSDANVTFSCIIYHSSIIGGKQEMKFPPLNYDFSGGSTNQVTLLLLGLALLLVL